VTDFETWLHDNSDRIYRYWVYKKMFTPYEQDQKFIDESCFVDNKCEYGIIREAIELPDGDILIGFIDPHTREDSHAYGYINYYKLSEITLAHSPRDMEDEDA